MNLTDPFQPRPAEIHLMFSCEPGGSLKDLRRGIRLFLTAYYPAEVAWKMALAPTYNYVFSRDRSKRSVMLTIDGDGQSAAIASVLIDLYCRLLTAQGMIRTAKACYTVSLDGELDLQRINALNTHFMWLSHFFNNHIGSKGERHLLN